MDSNGSFLLRHLEDEDWWNQYSLASAANFRTTIKPSLSPSSAVHSLYFLVVDFL